MLPRVQISPTSLPSCATSRSGPEVGSPSCGTRTTIVSSAVRKPWPCIALRAYSCGGSALHRAPRRTCSSDRVDSSNSSFLRAKGPYVSVRPAHQSRLAPRVSVP